MISVVNQESYVPELVESKYFIDESNTLTIDEVYRDSKRFSMDIPNPTDLGHQRNTIWLRLVYENASSANSDWVLDTRNKFIGEGRIYLDEGSGFSLLHDNLIKATHNTPELTTDFATYFSLPEGKRKTLYIEVRTSMSTHMHLDLFSSAAWGEKVDITKLITISCVTFLMTLAVLNILWYLSLRKKYHLYYSIQQLIACFSMLMASGFFIVRGCVFLLSLDIKNNSCSNALRHSRNHLLFL